VAKLRINGLFLARVGGKLLIEGMKYSAVYGSSAPQWRFHGLRVKPPVYNVVKSWYLLSLAVCRSSENVIPGLRHQYDGARRQPGNEMAAHASKLRRLRHLISIQLAFEMARQSSAERGANVSQRLTKWR